MDVWISRLLVQDSLLGKNLSYSLLGFLNQKEIGMLSIIFRKIDSFLALYNYWQNAQKHIKANDSPSGNFTLHDFKKFQKWLRICQISLINGSPSILISLLKVFMKTDVLFIHEYILDVVFWKEFRGLVSLLVVALPLWIWGILLVYARINIFSLVVIVQVSHRYFLVATHSRAISKSPIWGWRRAGVMGDPSYNVHVGTNVVASRLMLHQQ